MDHPYGLPKSALTLQQHEQVRVGTFYALKTAEASRVAHDQGIPFAIENPEPWEGHVSMFLLPEFLALASLPGVQCTGRQLRPVHGWGRDHQAYACLAL